MEYELLLVLVDAACINHLRFDRAELLIDLQITSVTRSSCCFWKQKQRNTWIVCLHVFVVHANTLSSFYASQFWVTTQRSREITSSVIYSTALREIHLPKHSAPVWLLMVLLLKNLGKEVIGMWDMQQQTSSQLFCFTNANFHIHSSDLIVWLIVSRLSAFLFSLPCLSFLSFSSPGDFISLSFQSWDREGD